MSRLSLFACAGLATVLYVGYSDPAATQFLLAQTGEAGGAPKTIIENDTVNGAKSESVPAAPAENKSEDEAAQQAAPSAPDSEKSEAPGDAPRQIVTEPKPEGIAPDAKEAAPAEDVFEPAEPAEEQAAPAEPAKPAESVEEAAPAESAKPDEPVEEAAPAEQTEPVEEAAEEAAEAKTAEPAPAADQDAAAKSSKASDIYKPKDEVEAAAFKVLDKHCARCHQEGLLQGKPSVQGGFGNVLKLEDVVADPNFVVPGVPDASKLYTQIAEGKMPYDCHQEGDCPTGEPPNEQEVKAIYDWLQTASAEQERVCEVKPLSEEDIAAIVSEDIDAQREHLQKGMRYISLVNFYNVCTKEEPMARFRHAVIKLLNSLSTESDPLTLRTIGAGDSIIAFNLVDLNWKEETWNRILEDYPYGVKTDSNKYKSAVSITNTPVVWIRGDWFANKGARPPLYHDILGLPQTFQELEKLLGVDTLANIDKRRVKRAGFFDSGVSEQNRLIERHSISTGYFWTSYDFKDEREEQNLFDRPLGPKGENAFKHDGGETIYSLPNGFQAYYLNTEKGARLDEGPQEIVRDKSQKNFAVINGISCMGCHNQGIRKEQDEIKAHVHEVGTFSPDAVEAVDALYPDVEQMTKILNQDQLAYKNAVREAGLNPKIDESGLESVNALSNHYDKDVHLKIVAGEFGVPSERLSKGLGAAGQKNAVLIKARLEQNTVPRERIEQIFPDVVESVTGDEAIRPKREPKPEPNPEPGNDKVGKEFELVLVADKSDYKQDEFAVFTVQSEKDCHLTLINVDSTGKGTVIYPNQFSQENFLKAGKEFRFPDEKSDFDFRLQDKGVEEVIAQCIVGKENPKGIEHDFKTRQFTDLGNYRNFDATRAIVPVKSEKGKGEDKGQIEAAVAEKGGDDKPGAKEKSKDEKVEIAKSEGSARIAIKITVE